MKFLFPSSHALEFIIFASFLFFTQSNCISVSNTDPSHQSIDWNQIWVCDLPSTYHPLSQFFLLIYYFQRFPGKKRMKDPLEIMSLKCLAKKSSWQKILQRFVFFLCVLLLTRIIHPRRRSQCAKFTNWENADLKLSLFICSWQMAANGFKTTSSQHLVTVISSR